MYSIDIEKLIRAKNLDFKEVARQLFPTNKYPEFALSRIIKGKGSLNADQISKLASFASMRIEDLFDGKNWKGHYSNNEYIFTNGEYKAVLNPETWTTKVFHKDSLFHETVIHQGLIPLREYITGLNSIIDNYKK